MNTIKLVDMHGMVYGLLSPDATNIKEVSVLLTNQIKAAGWSWSVLNSIDLL